MTQRPHSLSLTGMTAQAASASTAVRTGAIRKTGLSAPDGMIGSLSANFKKSANDWSRPNGPTTFGPFRICTPAQTFRSISNRYAMISSKATSSPKL